MDESLLFIWAGAGAGEKNPEPIKSGPAPQHWYKINNCMPIFLCLDYSINRFVQNARKYIDCSQHARQWIDFPQKAREYTDFNMHIMQGIYFSQHVINRFCTKW